MRLLSIDSVSPGAILARPLYNERGDILLNAGVELDDRYIRLLRRRRVTSVLVRLPDERDVPTEQIVSERVRAAALASVAKVFEVAARATADLRGLPADQLLAVLRRGDRSPGPAETAAFERLIRSIESIIDEVLAADTLPGLGSLKTHDNYTFCHSVDVAIVAILLGKKLFFTRDQLRSLATGCFLHDIGKVQIDPVVLTKPGQLTAEEFHQMRQHPAIGFELLKQQVPGDALARHVAFQHHERQDGSGYPRGLRGANRVARGLRDRWQTGRMILFAEVAAVADVYDALASDRPYRAALPAEKIVSEMRAMRQVHLNAEIVDVFLSVFPHYPPGLDLEVTAGPYLGFRGVVLATNPQAVDRPRIRLTRDAAGARLCPPLELDLTEEPETMITCIVGESRQ